MVSTKEFEASYYTLGSGYGFALKEREREWSGRVIKSGAGPLCAIVYAEHAKTLALWRILEHCLVATSSGEMLQLHLQKAENLDVKANEHAHCLAHIARSLGTNIFFSTHFGRRLVFAKFNSYSRVGPSPKLFFNVELSSPKRFEPSIILPEENIKNFWPLILFGLNLLILMFYNAHSRFRMIFH